MHSSRMRTDCFLGHLGGGECLPRKGFLCRAVYPGVFAQGEYAWGLVSAWRCLPGSWGICLEGVCLGERGVHPPLHAWIHIHPVSRMTDRQVQKHYLPATPFAGGNNNPKLKLWLKTYSKTLWHMCRHSDSKD